MTLETVYMTPEVFNACTTQALSIEKEEIMGLLFGTFSGNKARILSNLVMPRSDKRKDRVEISPDKLFEASIMGSQISSEVGEEVNIIGWYHSHPHITVEPSHVDLRTQLTLQNMDPRFVGIIISVFNPARESGQEIQITCFQTNPDDYKRRFIPLEIKSARDITLHGLQLLPNIPAVFAEEEAIMHQEVGKKCEHIATIANDAIYSMNLCNILSSSVNPLILHLEQRLDVAFKHNEALKQELDELRNKISQTCLTTV